MFASAGSFGRSPKLKVESVSKCALDFETLSYKLKLTIVQGCTVQQCTSLYIAELRVFAEQKRRQGCSQLTSVMGNVRVAHYLASFHKNVIFVKTRHCFICPPSLAEIDCVQGCGSKIGDVFQKCNFCENSSLFYLPAVPGGGGTDVAGYKPSDVCMLTVYLAQLAYKLEFNSVQGRTLLNDWHRMATEGCP